MASPLVGEKMSHASRPAGQKGSRHNEVIDLSADSDSAAGAAGAAGAASTSAISFRGMKLRDFAIGDRLGQTKDGGEGYQGCNSRVFRVSLRPYQPATVGRGGNNRNASEDDHRPPTASSPLSGGAADRSTGSGNLGRVSNPGTSRGECIAADMLGVGGQFWRGSFGACFRGDYGGVERAGGKGRDDLRRGGDVGVETEWALKMALALRGQDPAQAKRDMETEIDVLVGGRIPPHPNIMRGVHSFQDVIGQHLQPTLWAGLGPDVGETLSSRTSFVVMPLFTAGSLQALLNKRLVRCKGPPFLRLLEAMRFLEQMLSGVSHLLAHGVAHNDIKPDNWLLRADQRTLVLTDFGACVDSRNPPQARSPGLSPPPTPPTRSSGAGAAAAAAAIAGVQAADLLHRANPRDSAAAAPAAASAAAASAAAASGFCRPPGTGVPPATPAPAASTPCPPRGVPHAAPASAAAAAQAAGGTRGGGPSGPVECPPSLCSRPRLAGYSYSGSGVARFSAGAAAAAAAARASSRQKRPGGDDRSLPTSARSSVTGESTPDCGANECEDRGKKRTRCYGERGGDAGQARCGPAGPQDGGSRSCSTPKTSEKLVLPFSKYYVTGAPSVVAPELAQAWRGKKTVLDFRRSDVFSVGVCMYRMLRPDSGDIDNETGLEGKGPLEKIEGRFGQQAWPLPLFPENKGGCPYEVSQLCRGLLQADPAQRQDASEGLSLASWFVSRLEDAEKSAGKGVFAPRGNGAGHRRSTGPPTAGGGTGGGKGGGDEIPRRMPTAGAQERHASVGGPERHGLAVGRGDRQSALRREGLFATPTDGVFRPWWQSLVAAPVDRQHKPSTQGSGSAPVDGNRKVPAGARSSQSPRGAWANVERHTNSMLPSGGSTDRGIRERDGNKRAASVGAVAAGGSMSEEERRLGEPDELVRSDRISHMRDFFASAAPEDLFEALDARGWDVAAACANFDDDDDVANGGGRGGESGTSVKGDSTPASRVTLFFEGVAEELKGRRREMLSPSRHRQPLTGGSLQVPPPPFGR